MITMRAGEYLKHVMKEAGVSQSELAELMGTTQAEVSRLISMKRSITSKTALRLEKATGRSAESWLTMQLSYERHLLDERASQAGR